MVTTMFSSFFRAVMVALLLAAVAAGCATGPAGGPSSAQVEALLLQAGFKTVPARSEQQLAYLPQLPAGQVTVLTQMNRSWYVYPDLPQKRVYVGTLKEYEAYLALRQKANLPLPDPYASSLRQDAAMTADSKRYADVPGNWWPEFGDLGWQ
jgi:hypothetical protein